MGEKTSGLTQVLGLVLGAAGLAAAASWVQQYRAGTSATPGPSLKLAKSAPASGMPQAPGGTITRSAPGRGVAAPTDSAVALEAGTKSFRSFRYRDAVEQLRRAVAADPGLAEAWEYLGSSYAALQQPTEACQAYLKARTLAARSTRAAQWAALADQCFEARAYTEAIVAYRAAAAQDAGFRSKLEQVARSQKERGDANLTMSNVKTAALAYEVAYCLAPDDPTMRTAFERFAANPASGESFKQGLCPEAR